MTTHLTDSESDRAGRMLAPQVRFKIMRNIGLSFVRMGQYQDALQSFMQVMENVPDHQVRVAPSYLACRISAGVPADDHTAALSTQPAHPYQTGQWCGWLHYWSLSGFHALQRYALSTVLLTSACATLLPHTRRPGTTCWCVPTPWVTGRA
jgi:hypothetical protein